MTQLPAGPRTAHSRQAAPPRLWLDTVGADTAEHLDHLTTLIDTDPWNDPPPF